MKILSIPGCSTMIRRMMSAEIYTAMMVNNEAGRLLDASDCLD